MFLVTDIVPLITNNLHIKSIAKYKQTCEQANNFD